MRGETALYNAYSCAAGAFLPSKPFAAAPLTILEGSYSLHPALQTDFAVRVFVTCPPDVQAVRLRAREGIRYANFVQRWIPLEEGYFAAHDPAARCNFVLDTAEIFWCNIGNADLWHNCMVPAIAGLKDAGMPL